MLVLSYLGLGILFGEYQPLESANIHEIQSSEPLNVLKW